MPMKAGLLYQATSPEHVSFHQHETVDVFVDALAISASGHACDPYYVR